MRSFSLRPLNPRPITLALRSDFIFKRAVRALSTSQAHTLQYLVRLLTRSGGLTAVQRGFFPGLCSMFQIFVSNGGVLSYGTPTFKGQVGYTHLAHFFLSLLICGTGSVGQPIIPRLAVSESASGYFFQLAQRLSLTYFVQHQALDRKLRKIVKNKYRYVRRYVYVRPADRVRIGLRLIVVGQHLQPQRRWGCRVGSLLEDFNFAPEQSILRRLWQRHQQVALQALGLR